MAKEAVGKFVETINKSPDLVKKCRQVMQGSKDAAGFAAFGKENGFQFTLAEAQGYFQELLGTSKPAGLTELQEDALTKVAGGKGEQCMPNKGIAGLGESVRLFRNLGAAPHWTFYR